MSAKTVLEYNPYDSQYAVSDALYLTTLANVDDQVMPYIYLNNAMVLAKYFDKRSNMKKQPGAYFHIGYPLQYFCYNMLETAFTRFTGFYTVHGPSPLKKKTYEKLWKLEPELLNEACSHKFRQKSAYSSITLRSIKFPFCFII